MDSTTLAASVTAALCLPAPSVMATADCATCCAASADCPALAVSSSDEAASCSADCSVCPTICRSPFVIASKLLCKMPISSLRSVGSRVMCKSPSATCLAAAATSATGLATERAMKKTMANKSTSESTPMPSIVIAKRFTLANTSSLGTPKTITQPLSPTGMEAKNRSTPPKTYSLKEGFPLKNTFPPAAKLPFSICIMLSSSFNVL